MKLKLNNQLVGSDVHGRRQDFFQGWANYGSADESPPAGSKDGALVGLSRRQVVKIVNK